MHLHIHVRARSGALPPDLREHAEKKAHRLDRMFHGEPEVHVVHALERGQHIVEVSASGDGIVLRSEERCGDPVAAIDRAIDKMEKQAARFRERRRDDHRKHGRPEAAPVGAEATGDEGEAGRIVRRKRYSMKPMAEEEAARTMELLDHSFFLFTNSETGSVSLVYRRRDGHYGIIEPED